MKKQYKCIWELYRYILDDPTPLLWLNGKVYGTNKKAIENEIRFMLKQKYRTKEFRDKYRCELMFRANDDSRATFKTIKSI